MIDEAGLDSFHGRCTESPPRALWLLPGNYRVRVLDANNQTLHEKAVTIGTEEAIVEL